MTVVKYTLDTLPEATGEDIKRLKDMREEDIDFSDIPPLTEEFWANAKPFGELFRPQKKQVTVRIDADILLWLKSGGKGYQTRLNEILRHEMLAHFKK